MIPWIILGVLILSFGLVVFRGAPYVPTHYRSLAIGLKLLKLQSNDLLVDLGSGDGSVLRAAARHGWRATGYELNPVLCAIAWLRCLPQHNLVNIKLRDYWLSELPPDTKAVFIFLAGPYMPRMGRKLEEVMRGRSHDLQVLSYAYEIPGLKPKRSAGGFYLYQLEPAAKTAHGFTN